MLRTLSRKRIIRRLERDALKRLIRVADIKRVALLEEVRDGFGEGDAFFCCLELLLASGGCRRSVGDALGGVLVGLVEEGHVVVVGGHFGCRGKVSCHLY